MADKPERRRYALKQRIVKVGVYIKPVSRKSQARMKQEPFKGTECRPTLDE